MKQVKLEIVKNERIAEGINMLKLKGDVSAVKGSGQFVNIEVEGRFLRRPFSVCDCEGDMLTVAFRQVGEGTERLTQYKCGEYLDVLTGLGNGFDTSESGDAPLLIGGGSGVPPMLLLCKELVAEGKSPTVLLGFKTKSEIILTEQFDALGVRVHMTTQDGSEGAKGVVTDALGSLQYTYVYACGPEGMLKAIDERVSCGVQYSFEARMGCGFGACMGCSCETKDGMKRVCREGPVFRAKPI